MKKLVDGVMLTMPAAEAAAMQTEWAANVAKQAADAAKPKEPSLAERVAALEDFAQLEKLAAQK